MERACLDCKERLIGRSDKKFCDDNCRSNYNNAQRSVTNPAVKKINMILKKNHLILEHLNPGRRKRISATQLMSSGINLSYFTHQQRAEGGKTYNFCYDQGYTQLDERVFILVKQVKGQK